MSRILAPAVLAFLVGAGAALIAGRLDSRLRNSAQIAAVSEGLPLLGVVSDYDGREDDGLAALALAMRHAESKTTGSLVLLPLSSQQAADVLSKTVTSDLARLFPPITVSSEGISAAAEGHAVILVADSRVDRPRHLKHAVHLLNAIGATAEGVVLVVPSSTDRLRALVDDGNG